uniref:Uncharacterized protein n=1 Tax=Opuntia streptacantha TaxID=393608 RepID=A0A7C8ZY47_OPUST
MKIHRLQTRTQQWMCHYSLSYCCKQSPFPHCLISQLQLHQIESSSRSQDLSMAPYRTSYNLLGPHKYTYHQENQAAGFCQLSPAIYPDICGQEREFWLLFEDQEKT